MKCLLLALAVTLGGCATRGPAPMRVRYAEIAQRPIGPWFDGRPVIIEFRPGDRVPVALRVDAESFDMVPAAPPIEFVAKEHCFVRVDGEGFRSSLDGISFDARPKVRGHFQLALSVTPAGAKLLVSVTTPRHAQAP